MRPLLLARRLPLPAWTARLPRDRVRPGEFHILPLTDEEQAEVTEALAPLVAPALPKPSRQFPPAYGGRCWGADWHNDLASGFGDVLAICWVVEAGGMGVTVGGPAERADEVGEVLLVDQAETHACLPPGWPRLNADSYPHVGHWVALNLTVERHQDLLTRLRAI